MYSIEFQLKCHTVIEKCMLYRETLNFELNTPIAFQKFTFSFSSDFNQKPIPPFKYVLKKDKHFVNFLLKIPSAFKICPANENLCSIFHNFFAEDLYRFSDMYVRGKCILSFQILKFLWLFKTVQQKKKLCFHNILTVFLYRL